MLLTAHRHVHIRIYSDMYICIFIRLQAKIQATNMNIIPYIFTWSHSCMYKEIGESGIYYIVIPGPLYTFARVCNVFI